MLLPFLLPHVGYVCELLQLIMPLVMLIVRHVHPGSIQSDIGHRELTHQLLLGF